MRILYLLLIPILLAGIVQAAPVSDFSYTTAGLTASYTDTSTGSPTGWAWYFGDETYNNTWKSINSSSGWVARDRFAVAVQPNGSIVLMGGMNGAADPLGDVWISTNEGVTWVRQTASASWVARYGHAAAAFPDGNITIAGGYATSSYERNDTWKSTDSGVTWTNITANPGWMKREYHRMVVLPGGDLVLLGGWDSMVATLYNDTWRSTDEGATWTQMNASSGWGGRFFPAVVSLPNGHIVITGGASSWTTYLNDTWRSTDKGATWTQMNASSGWTARYASGVVALPDGSILLIGGESGTGASSVYKEDIWRSADEGATWVLVNLSTGIAPARSNAIVVISPSGNVTKLGGANSAGTRYNTTHQMISVSSSAQNPARTYTANGTYSVRLQSRTASAFNLSAVKSVTVDSSAITALAQFTADRLTVRVPNRVTFTDTSAGATSWDWSFGDGTANVTTQSPAHQYVKRGMFTTTLIINGGASKNSSTVRAIGWGPFGW